MTKRVFTWEFGAVNLLYFLGLGLTANLLSNASSMIAAAQSAFAAPPNPYILMAEFGVAQAIGRAICIAWNVKHKTPPLPYAPLVLSFALQIVSYGGAIRLTSPLLVRLEFLLVGVGYGLVWSSFSGVVMKLAKIAARGSEEEEKALTSYGTYIPFTFALCNAC